MKQETLERSPLSILTENIFPKKNEEKNCFHIKLIASASTLHTHTFITDEVESISEFSRDS